MALVTPAFLSVWMTAIAMLAIAIWLLVIDPSSRIHRVFAWLLALRAATFALGAVASGGSAFANLVAVSLAPYLHIAIPMAAIYFLCLFPKPRTVLANTKWGPYLWLGLTLALLAWYALDHSAYGQLLQANGRARWTTVGPLSFFTAIRLAIFGLGAFIVARDYYQNPDGSAGYSLFLIYAGFSLNALYDSIWAVYWYIEFELWTNPVVTVWDWTRSHMGLATLPFVLASFVYIGLAARGEKQTSTLQEPRRFLLYVVPLAILSSSAAIWLDRGGDSSPFATFVLGLWRLSLPLLVTYALFRHQLFDVDVRVKGSVARVVMMAIFTLSFFLLLEAAEALFSVGDSIWSGMAVAAGLTLVAHPLMQLAGRAADRLMPDTKPVIEQTVAERKTFYAEQFGLVSQDGQVSTKERIMLNELAFSLRLTRAQTTAIERGQWQPSSRAAKPVAATPERQRTPASRAALAIFVALGFALLSQGVESVIVVSSFTAGLVAAGLLSLLMSPAERYLDYLTRPREERKRRRRKMLTYQHAVRAAWADGRVSAKELQYLDSLSEKLAISWADRKRAEGRFALTRRAKPTGSIGSTFNEP